MITCIACPSGRSVDFPILRKQLIAQDAPLPGVYPARYKKAVKDRVAIYEPPAFGERIPQKRNELPAMSGISGHGEHCIFGVYTPPSVFSVAQNQKLGEEI